MGTLIDSVASMMKALPGIAMLGLLVTAGCGGEPACWADRSCAGGDTCERDEQCMSGLCTTGVCEASCVGHADCEAGSYCMSFYLNGQERAQCRTRCGYDFDTSEHYDLVESSEAIVCHEEVPTRCDALADPAAYCDVCGCEAGAICSFAPCIGGGCECNVPMPLGSPCDHHDACISRNCSGQYDSTGPRYCQLPAGETCDPTMTTSMCVHCLEHDAGVYRCLQSCEGTCEGSAHCLGDRAANEFACYRDCEDDPSDCGPGFRCYFYEGALGGYACVPD